MNDSADKTPPPSTSRRIGSSLSKVGVPWLYLSLNLLYFAPFSIYFGNREDYNLSFLTLTGDAWWVWLPGLVVLVVLALSAPPGVTIRASSVLWGLVTLTWVQANLLPFPYGVLDGSEITWTGTGWRSAYEGVLWLGVLVIALSVPRRVLPSLRTMGHLAIATQVVIAGFTLSQLPERSTRFYEIEPPPPSLAEFSSTKNVMYIVLDEFSSEVFARLMAEKADLRNAFSGFTFFEQNLGVYPTTRAAVPALLTGESYKNQVPFSDFLHDAREEGVGSHLHSQGYVVDEAHNNPGMCPRDLYTCYTIPFPFVSRSGYVRYQQASLLDLALFRSLPDPIKWILYSAGRWTFRNLPGIDAEEETHSLPSNSLKFARILLEDMRLAGPEPRFKFVHLGLPHTPVVLDEDCNFLGPRPYSLEAFENQSICALRTVISYFDRWRELGIYDEAAIVLSSDHGHRQPPASFEPSTNTLDPTIVGGALALLAVKPPQADGELAQSGAPTSLADIPSTIADLAGVPGAFDGTSVLDLRADEARTRQYFHYHWLTKMWRDPYMPPMDRYLVDGDPRKEASWKFVGRLLRPTLSLPATAIDIGTAEAEAYLGIGWSTPEVSTGDRTVVWTVGDRATLDLTLPRKVPLRMRMKVLNPGFNPGQTITASIDGERVAFWEIADNDRWVVLVADVPALFEAPPYSVVELEFATQRQTDEGRRLAVLFDEIVLEPSSPLERADDPSEGEAFYLIDLGSRDARAYLHSGWSGDEEGDDGRTIVWALGPKATLAAPVATDQPLRLEAVIYNHAFNENQEIRVEVGGEVVARWEVTEPEQWVAYECTIPPQLTPSAPPVQIDFVFRSYQQRGTDTRNLAAVFDKVTLTPEVVAEK